jgi:hypothetical protein
MLHPLVALWMLIAIIFIFAASRNKAIAAFLLAVFTIPVGQVIVLGGVHFTVLRILIIAGLVRRISFAGSGVRNKFPGGFNGIDLVVVLWTVSALTILSLQWMRMDAFIHNLGDFLDALGGYLVVRSLIPDGDAIRRAIKALAIVCVIQGVCMVNEQITHVNVFGYLGGMSAGVTVRDGHIRSEGVMGCLYAGAFSGAVIPLFLWLWTDKKSRTIAYVGLVGASAMVAASYSSTSWMALGGTLLGLAFWPMRKKMRWVRWGLALSLITVHLVMKAPVWALIARIDLTGSSSGFHRYMLVDNCIRHFSDWWLLGYRYFNNWGWDMWDLCNQFVVAALTGGLSTLIFYVLIFTRSFGAIGRGRKRVSGNRNQEWLFWCFGTTLFANVVAHFGINYMAQMMMTIFPSLACISVALFEATRVKNYQSAPITTDAAYAFVGQERYIESPASGVDVLSHRFVDGERLA